jgi:hypothetical protein
MSARQRGLDQNLHHHLGRHLRPSLRPNGEIVVVDANRSTQDHGTPPALLRCEFSRVGYTQVTLKDMPSAGAYLATFFWCCGPASGSGYYQVMPSSMTAGRAPGWLNFHRYVLKRTSCAINLSVSQADGLVSGAAHLGVLLNNPRQVRCGGRSGGPWLSAEFDAA